MNQALPILLARLEEKGLVNRKAFLQAQADQNRITAQAGDNLQDGVSVGSYVIRRVQLILEADAASPSIGTRAEANVEVAVFTQPATNGEPPTQWEGNEFGLIVTFSNGAAQSYTTLSAEEVKALPGSDQFLMALNAALIAKMKVNNLPPPPEPPPPEP